MWVVCDRSEGNDRCAGTAILSVTLPHPPRSLSIARSLQSTVEFSFSQRRLTPARPHLSYIALLRPCTMVLSGLAHMHCSLLGPTNTSVVYSCTCMSPGCVSVLGADVASLENPKKYTKNDDILGRSYNILTNLKKTTIFSNVYIKRVRTARAVRMSSDDVMWMRCPHSRCVAYGTACVHFVTRGRAIWRV